MMQPSLKRQWTEESEVEVEIEVEVVSDDNMSVVAILDDDELFDDWDAPLENVPHEQFQCHALHEQCGPREKPETEFVIDDNEKIENEMATPSMCVGSMYDYQLDEEQFACAFAPHEQFDASHALHKHFDFDDAPHEHFDFQDGLHEQFDFDHEQFDFDYAPHEQFHVDAPHKLGRYVSEALLLGWDSPHEPFDYPREDGSVIVIDSEAEGDEPTAAW